MERDMRKRQSPMARGLTPPFGFCKAMSLASRSRLAHGCMPGKVVDGGEVLEGEAGQTWRACTLDVLEGLVEDSL
eukprot:2288872-Pleurochrysis_carterae.AAC.1